MGDYIFSGRGKCLRVRKHDRVQEEKKNFLEQIGLPLHLQIIPLLLKYAFGRHIQLTTGKKGK